MAITADTFFKKSFRKAKLEKLDELKNRHEKIIKKQAKLDNELEEIAGRIKVGHARIAPDEDRSILDKQLEALKEAGCEKIIIDENKDFNAYPKLTPQRKELETKLLSITTNYTLVVWRLDRLGGSLPKMMEFIQRDIYGWNNSLISLCDDINTGSDGRMIFKVFNALQEYHYALHGNKNEEHREYFLYNKGYQKTQKELTSDLLRSEWKIASENAYD